MSEKLDIWAWLRKVQPYLTNGGVEFLGDPTSANMKGSTRVLVANLATYEEAHRDNKHFHIGKVLTDAGAAVDYCYMPPKRDFHFFESYGVPFMFGANSKRPVTDFDLVLFVWRDSLEAFNLPHLMQMSHIPLFKDERMSKVGPYIGITGQAVFSAGVLQDLVDFSLLGEPEAMLPKLVKRIESHPAGTRGTNRRKFLAAAKQSVPGFYEPEKGYDVTVARVSDMSEATTLTSYSLPYSEAGKTAYRAELSRGCPAECLNCQESWVSKPYREQDPDTVIEKSMEGQVSCGALSLVLDAQQWNYFSQPYTVLNTLGHQFQELEPLDIRPDVLVRQPDLMEIIGHKNVHTATISMDGISQRLRRFLHKGFTEKEIVSSIHLLSDYITNIELSVLLTGKENKSDMQEFINFLQKAQIEGVQLSVVVRVLINKRFTPLQWMENKAVGAEDSFQPIQDACKDLKIRYRFGTLKAENYLRQVFERGDAELKDLILEISLEKKFLFYGSVSADFYNQFVWAIRKFKIDDTRYFQELPNSKLPWDNIDTGVKKSYLRKRYEEGLKYKESEICLPLPKEASAACNQCGACSPEQRKALTRHKYEASDITMFPLAERKSRWRVVLQITKPEFRVVPKRFYVSAVIQAVLAQYPELSADVLSVYETSVDYILPNSRDWFYGMYAVDVLFSQDVSELKLQTPPTSTWKVVTTYPVQLTASIKSDLRSVEYRIPIIALRDEETLHVPSLEAPEFKVVQFRTTKEGSVKPKEMRISKDSIHSFERRGQELQFATAPQIDPYYLLEAITRQKRFKWHRENLQVTNLVFSPSRE